MFAPGVSLEDINFCITHIIKHVAYLLGYTGSLEILLQVGPVLMENLKQLEVVAPNLAELHYSWLGNRSLGRQPPACQCSFFILVQRPRPCCPTGCWTSTPGAGVHAACPGTAKKGARPGRMGGGREDF